MKNIKNAGWRSCGGAAWPGFWPVCICLGNVNIAAFAAESVETGGTGATPSNAKKENSATPSNADRSASEIWLPDGMMKGAELLEEAERAVTNDYRFDFNNLMKMIDAGNPDEEDDEAEDESDTGSAERYKKLFKGYDSFTLFYVNGKFGLPGRRQRGSVMHISWCVFQKKPIMLILPEKIPSGPQLLRRLMRQKAATS